MTRSTLAAIAVFSTAVATPGAFAAPGDRALIDDVAQRVGLNLLTVGAPGNRGVLQSEVGRPKWQFDEIPADMGAVGYEYRINKTEFSATQLGQFANAYWQVNEAGGGRRGDHQFAGGFFYNTDLSQPPNYTPIPGFANVAAGTSWYMAARVCNWLHNGAPDAATATWDDFNTGAYDTTTFGTWETGAFGVPISTEQFRRSEDARFWIPSLDEWIKAAHYDPDRYGEAPEGEEGGYWMRMGGQDEPLISGRPEDGGETSGGSGVGDQPVDVGQYPDVQSPWGLLDTSGGLSEWVEDKPLIYQLPDGTYVSESHYDLGSIIGAVNYDDLDLIDDLKFLGPTNTVGLRIASAIPVPGTGAIVGVAGACFLRRKSR